MSPRRQRARRIPRRLRTRPVKNARCWRSEGLWDELFDLAKGDSRPTARMLGEYFADAPGSTFPSTLRTLDSTMWAARTAAGRNRRTRKAAGSGWEVFAMGVPPRCAWLGQHAVVEEKGCQCPVDGVVRRLSFRAGGVVLSRPKRSETPQLDSTCEPDLAQRASTKPPSALPIIPPRRPTLATSQNT